MPILTNINSVIPGSGDSLFNLYVLEQVFQNILKGMPLYYGQMLFPSSNTLAFSSNLFIYQIIYAPLRLLGLHPQAAFNMLFVLMLALLSCVVYEWMYRKLKHFGYALFGTLMAVFASMPLYYLTGHFQLFSGYWYLIVLVMIDNYFERYAARYVFGAVIVVVVMAAADPAVAVMGVLFVAVYLGARWRSVVDVVRRDFIIPRRVVAIAATAAVAGVFLYLILAPYLHVVTQFGYYSRKLILACRTRPESFLTASPFSLFHKPVRMYWGLHEAIHFTGFVYLFMLALGVYHSFRANVSMRALLIACAVLYLASFGPIYIGNTDIPANPFYAIPMYLFPGFNTYVAIVGIRETVKLIPVRTFAITFVFAAVVFIGAESIARLDTMPFSYSQIRQKYDGLSSYFKRGDSVIRFPYATWASTDVLEEMIGMLQTDARTVNGYSGQDPVVRRHFEGAYTVADLTNSSRISALFDDCRSNRINWLMFDKTAIPATIMNNMYSAEIPMRCAPIDTGLFLLLQIVE
ncbi:MAG: hypothetical protein HZC28_06895 [Spirochaetes bacterium]|nr:hypothetical protein [Spirochaetota bacterium]